MKKNRWKAMAALAAAAVLALSACGNSGEDGSTQGSRIHRRRGCSRRSAHRNRGRLRRGWKK